MRTFHLCYKHEHKIKATYGHAVLLSSFVYKSCLCIYKHEDIYKHNLRLVQSCEISSNRASEKEIQSTPFIADTLGDRELVSLIARVRNSGDLFQSNVCYLFLPGIELLSVLSGFT